MEVRRWPWDVRKLRAEACGGILAECGDALMFGSSSARKKSEWHRDGSVQNVFNALVDGCAIGALQPGGIRLLGLHFEAQP